MQNESYSAVERAAIWQFVEAGGALVVLGDHTDLQGFEAPSNELLEPVGVSFVYDSAYPLRPWWRHSQSLRWHPAVTGVEGAGTGIGTGASLAMANWSADPVIVGRYGISDYGNRANAGRGGLLGDYRHQIAAEKFGDLPLVVEASYGEGRVVVFGDTSTFQPLAMTSSHVFIDRLFNFLVHGEPNARLFLPLLLAGALLLGVVQAGRPGPVLFFAWAVLLGFGAGRSLESAGPPHISADRPIALVDASLVSATPGEHFEDNSAAGIPISLLRAGYFVRHFDEATIEDLASTDLLFIISPTRRPDEDYVEAARSLVERGGTLFLATSRYTAQAAKPLLDLCGVTIGSEPLGDAIVRANGATLQFVEAWPVRPQVPAIGAQPQIIVALAEDPIVTRTEIGDGYCIVFGDERFFINENFEDEFSATTPHVAFVEGLLPERKKRQEQRP